MVLLSSGGPQQRIWQGFADLALGLMAVLALVLVMLLWREGRTNAALRQQKQQLERERVEFTVELLNVVARTQRIVEDQNAAERWVRGLFDPKSGCQLEVGAGDVLRRRSAETGTPGSSAGASSDDFYGLGETKLHAHGRGALKSCCGSFLRLAFCLSPPDDQGSPRSGGPRDEPAAAAGASGPQFSAAERLALCLEGSDPEEHQRNQQAVRLLGRGIEALVLEGNTDSEALKWNVARDRALHVPGLSHHPEDEKRRFVDNAWLGAERARHALGYLLTLPENVACLRTLGLAIAEASGDGAETTATATEAERTASDYVTQVLMGRVRVETPSFGRYQAGPAQWRTGRCASSTGSCPEARNLSLKLRWRKDELRRPFLDIRHRICALLRDTKSSMSKGLRSAHSLERRELRRLLENSGWGQDPNLDLGSVSRRLGCGQGDERPATRPTAARPDERPSPPAP